MMFQLTYVLDILAVLLQDMEFSLAEEGSVFENSGCGNKSFGQQGSS